ncbi:glycosyltransferase family 2 protein [Candidatus Methanoperedens nitratireducens]|uniref:Glycosyl transferase n=1 Tax=Candidatus Methanoperedens nitratireducens TaxID=1392998 RepID=A0A284VQP9_9EURY|nr:glycosyltransferase [Candidatus Methanoperedens nitroreducens]SNQ61621.1 Glycosyl transferase [Candidatus Methanoperedens nitroreducens]
MIRRDRVIKSFVVILMLISLFVILYGKAGIDNKNQFFLFIYGITVTTMVFFMFFITHLKYTDLSEEIRDKNVSHILRKPFVSCIFAVYNEEVVVRRCIDSLLNSTYKNKEIIVVNDASTDKTKDVLEEYKNQIRVINLPKNVGKKRAIGEGIRASKGEIFVFTDSDSVVAPDAIERIIEIFMYDSDIGAVSGHGRALNAGENFLTKAQDSWYETQFSVKKAMESAYGAVTCVSGPLAVFRREAIYNYIPAWENDQFLGKEFRFATDRQLTGYVLGSKYIGKKLKEKYADSPFVKEINYPERDWKVIYCKSAKVYTVVPNTLKKVIRQHTRWKKSFIRSLFFTGTFYWRKHPIVAIKYYLGAVFTILGPFIALRHLIYLPVTGNELSGLFYLSGITFIGLLYGVMFKLENPSSGTWKYRPFMSLLSTLLLSWLIFYSILTIKKSIWHRG